MELRLRAIVEIGLRPLLLDVAAGVARLQFVDERALRTLGLAEPHGARLLLTALGRDVLHQLEALRCAGLLPALRPGLAWWAAPLLVANRPSPYGEQLLAWLRTPLLLETCRAEDCDGAVVGIALRGEGEPVLACAEHRCLAQALTAGGLDRHLAEVSRE